MIGLFYAILSCLGNFIAQPFSVSSLTPMPINITSLILFKITSIVGFLRRFSLNFDDSNAKHENHIKPVVANVSPRPKKDSMLLPELESINCGKNAKKNKATFGLKVLVMTPCLYICHLSNGRVDANFSSMGKLLANMPANNPSVVHSHSGIAYAVHSDKNHYHKALPVGHYALFWQPPNIG